ncbi:YcnI family protein [Actinomadura atramentaria]|uniref:YcnI family copper-binding membrane protein n=1 Tax=Actinomadura atramentaria TaxID=1990 RepID=UPI0003784898|nr:YcnI family protein [Actinomadura atramentaria]
MVEISPALRRSGTVVAGAAVASALLGGVASAHVTISSAQPAVRGEYAQLALRAPNESEKASMVKLELDVPADTPLPNVTPEPVPGWNVEVETVTLDRPVRMEKITVTKAVRSIVWTAERGKGTPVDNFQSFQFMTKLPTNTDKLVFSAVQTYSDGSKTEWNQPVGPDGAEPENPAPTLALAAPEQKTAPTETKMSNTDTTARWLGGVGIAVGVVGIGFGALRGRRRAAGD